MHPPAAVLLLVAALAAGTGEVRARTADEGFAELASKDSDGRKVVRIGLEASHSIRLSSSRPFRIVDPVTGRPVWKDAYASFVAAVAEGGPEGTGRIVYRIQAGAFSTEDAAEAERLRLERTYTAPAVVVFVPDRRSWRVRVGRADDREALGPLLDRLRGDGATGVWITEEPPEPASAVRLRLVDSSYNGQLADAERLAVLPGEANLEVDGKAYRGILELRINRFGAVQPVNWIEAEGYLAGVVPAELGPEIWPQIEALKAQAVAARTYLWRNLGQFSDDGYDLCATPRCQVYSGVAVEHPMSDRAVAATRGEILVFDGEPISALYTATCGGHTENGFEIFPEERAPYLKGVPCRAESAALATQRGRIEGRAAAPRIVETGEDVTRDWTLLTVAGVFGESLDAQAPVTGADLDRWITAAARLAGRSPVRAAPDGATLARACASLVEGMGWGERARVLLSGDDSQALVRDAAVAELSESERRSVALLVQAGALRPFPDGSYGVHRAVSRGRMAVALARIEEAYDGFALREGAVSSVLSGRLRLVQGKGSLELPLAPRPYLFALGGDRAVPAASLDLWPGDRVRYRTDGEGRINFLELRPPVKGTSDDRFAKVYSWEVRMTRAEVEEALRRRLDVGKLQDLKVVRRGVSGRIVELSVTGQRGSSVVKGFDVRTLLGLRESLAVIEVQRDEAGEIFAVVFAGKGWGHGVGLCQVGAYGMALRGATYREILAHYYSGTRLETVP